MQMTVFRGRGTDCWIVARDELSGFLYRDDNGEALDVKPGSAAAHLSTVEWDQVTDENALPARLRRIMAARGVEFAVGDLALGQDSSSPAGADPTATEEMLVRDRLSGLGYLG
jgi:hypothetical protein